MKRLMIFVLAILFLLSYNDTLATDLKLGISGEKTFKLNNKLGEPQLEFLSEAPMEDIEGSVEAEHINSDIILNPGNIEASKGTIRFLVSAMKTGISTRDKHLRSSQWLDAEKYPEIQFQLMKLTDVKLIESADGKTIIRAKAVGIFMMHGESKEIEADISLTYLKESPATKKRATGDLFFVEGKFQVALADFKVSGKKGIIGSKVGEKIQVQFKLFYSQI